MKKFCYCEFLFVFSNILTTLKHNINTLIANVNRAKVMQET